MVLVETIFSTDPHVARSILENSQYQIAADAARVVDLVCEGFKCTRFGQIDAEPATVCANQ